MNEIPLPQSTMCPAILSEDTKFIAFAQECTEAASGADAQARIAELTHEFVQNWRMPDPRFLQLQPNAPYASYLLYLSETANLCIVLDIFMAQQAAIAHNHLCWCVFSCLEGVERELLFEVTDDMSVAPVERMTRLREPGVVTIADAARGAFHQVECAEGDMAISLHIYGADIGRLERQMWDKAQSRYISFNSGYSNSALELPTYLSAKDGHGRTCPV